MKIRLRYQASGYDCGAATVQNAVSYVFAREEVTPALIRRIAEVTLDNYDAAERPGREGTSSEAMGYLASWLNRYGATTGLPVHASYHVGDEVSYRPGSPLLEALAAGGAVAQRVYHGLDHWVLVTGLEERPDGRWLRIFDPYELGPDDVGEKGAWEVVEGRPRSHNRLVSLGRMECGERRWYSLTANRPADALALTRTDVAG